MAFNPISGEPMHLMCGGWTKKSHQELTPKINASPLVVYRMRKKNSIITPKITDSKLTDSSRNTTNLVVYNYGEQQQQLLRNSANYYREEDDDGTELITGKRSNESYYRGEEPKSLANDSSIHLKGVDQLLSEEEEEEKDINDSYSANCNNNIIDDSYLSPMAVVARCVHNNNNDIGAHNSMSNHREYYQNYKSSNNDDPSAMIGGSNNNSNSSTNTSSLYASPNILVVSGVGVSSGYGSYGWPELYDKSHRFDALQKRDRGSSSNIDTNTIDTTNIIPGDCQGYNNSSFQTQITGNRSNSGTIDYYRDFYYNNTNAKTQENYYYVTTTHARDSSFTRGRAGLTVESRCRTRDELASGIYRRNLEKDNTHVTPTRNNTNSKNSTSTAKTIAQSKDATEDFTSRHSLSTKNISSDYNINTSAHNNYSNSNMPNHANKSNNISRHTDIDTSYNNIDGTDTRQSADNSNEKNNSTIGPTIDALHDHKYTTIKDNNKDSLFVNSATVTPTDGVEQHLRESLIVA